MYSWQHFIKLPGIKDLDPREQYRRYSNLMLEASNNNNAAAAAASSAAAGAGAGGGGTPAWRRTQKTSDEGVLFMDNYDTNYKYFIVDEKGVNTGRIDTGIVVNDWYENNNYIIQSKGYVFVFRNEDNNNLYQFLFIRANGTIAGSNIIQNPHQYDLLDGKYFYYNQIVSNDVRNIVYFDGDEIYTQVFNATNTTVEVASNSNTYMYETRSYNYNNSSFNDDTSGSRLIVSGTSSISNNITWYSIQKGTITELYQEENGYDYSNSWDFQSKFLVSLRNDPNNNNYSNAINFYSTETGELLQNVGLTASNYSFEKYLFHGTSKFSTLFSSDNDYLVVNYDGVVNKILTEIVQKYTHWDFYCSTKTPSFNNKNFISENIVFKFYNDNGNKSVLGIFDGATQSNLFTLDGYNLDLGEGKGMFTENVFTIPVDSSGTYSTGELSQLIINSTGYTFSNFGFNISSLDNSIQLYDKYVYKFNFVDRHEYQIFDTYGTRLLTATFSPNNNEIYTKELFLINNYNDSITYYSNDITLGLSPSSIEVLGLTVSKLYDDDSWETYYNKPDGINDGKLLLSGNDYSAVDNFVFLTGTTEPVYLDFSYLNDMDGWNVHLCKNFIIVQYQDVDGNGYAKTYDFDGNITQDLSFGYCEWISNDSVVGDLGVIRFTNWGTTKRVFLTKNTYSVYDLEWEPYNHFTLFNDYLWKIND